MRISRTIARLALPALLLAACRNPRAEAVSELQRLRGEMDRHARSFGRYPATLDVRRPEVAENLPYAPARGIPVMLLESDASGFQAVATRRPWSCTLQVERAKGERVHCSPNATAESASSDTARARRTFDSVLSPPPDSARKQ
jgi:hypothetical protein